MKNKDYRLSDIMSDYYSADERRFRGESEDGNGRNSRASFFFSSDSWRHMLLIGLPTLAGILVVAVLVVKITISSKKERVVSFDSPELVQGELEDKSFGGRHMDVKIIDQLINSQEADSGDVDEVPAVVPAISKHDVPAFEAQTESPSQDKTREEAQVVVKKLYANALLNFRAAPGLEAERKGKIRYGEAVTVLAEQGEWFQIRRNNGEEGYVAGEYLQKNKPPVLAVNIPAPSVKPNPVVTKTPTVAPTVAPTTKPTPVPDNGVRYVKVSMANIRSEATVSSERRGFAVRGDKVRIVDRVDEWYKIKTDGGLVGFIRSDLLQKTVVVAADSAPINMGRSLWVRVKYGYVRSEPTTDSDAVGSVKLNEKVYQIHTDGSWSKVELDNGKTGYVRNDLLTTQKPPESAIAEKVTNVDVYVTVSSAVLRKEATTQSDVVGSASLNDKMKQLSKTTHWSKVKTASGAVAYIHNSLISTKAPANTNSGGDPSSSKFKAVNKSVWVRVAVANMRENPDTLSDIVARVKYAAKIKQVSTNGSWSKVKTADGKVGYMLNSLFQKTAISNSTTTNPTPEEPADTPANDSASAVNRRKALMATAKKGLGVPYVFGGASMNGFDCSGLVYWAYKQHGIKLPHNANAQSRVGKLRRVKYTKGDFSHLRVGDLLFFSRKGNPRNGFNHVGLYAGNGMMLHAPMRGKVVSFVRILDRPAHRQPTKVGRLIYD